MFAWCNMRRRVRTYPTYAGVEIDERWSTFAGFLAHPPAGTYEVGLCLCRTDDVGPYSPENCRWDTKTNSAKESWRTHPIRQQPNKGDEVEMLLTRALGKLRTPSAQDGV